LVYGLIMKAAAETTLEIAANPRPLGARLGLTAALHTWGSAMTHHPHVHMIVPGGSLYEDGVKWVSAKSDFLVHVNVLARLFRGKMLAMLTEAHAQGRLVFLGHLAALADSRVFKRFLGPVRQLGPDRPDMAGRSGGLAPTILPLFQSGRRAGFSAEVT
jgi:hypothetical protein